jgi:hypothetical protein
MRPLTYLALLLSSASVVLADGAFYGDPPDATHPWSIHDMNRPQPSVVQPGNFSSQENPGKPPSDAIVLFGGADADISKWMSDKNPGEPTKWEVKNGIFQCVPGSGYARTKEEFSDCQLHVEWTEPEDIKGASQGRGNSGIFLMGQVEVQVLDNYNNPTYADGSAGSIYGINPPMVNPLRKPGEWQMYDIVFRRPLFKDGKEIDPGYLTVFINGVLVQDHTPIDGGGGHKARSHSRPFPDQGPLKLQDHGNPVKYRNIWYRPLPKRALDGGDTSVMSPEATKAKRDQIAKTIREDAATKQGNDKMLRLFESLVYASDEASAKEATTMVSAFASEVKELKDKALEAKKGEILHVNSALDYLVKFKIIDDLDAHKTLTSIIKAQEWDKKK